MLPAAFDDVGTPIVAQCADPLHRCGLHSWRSPLAAAAAAAAVAAAAAEVGGGIGWGCRYLNEVCVCVWGGGVHAIPAEQVSPQHAPVPRPAPSARCLPAGLLPSLQLTRLLTAPMGAEVTGTIFVELNGRLYIFSNIQHPYDGSAYAPFTNATGKQGRAWAGAFWEEGRAFAGPLPAWAHAGLFIEFAGPAETKPGGGGGLPLTAYRLLDAPSPRAAAATTQSSPASAGTSATLGRSRSRRAGRRWACRRSPRPLTSPASMASPPRPAPWRASMW